MSIIGLVPPALFGAEDLFVLPGLRLGSTIGFAPPALLRAEDLSVTGLEVG